MNNIQKQKLPKPRTNNKKKIILYIILGIIASFFILTIISIKPALTAYQSANEGKQNFLVAEQAIKEQDLSKASEAIKNADKNFSKAQNNLRYLSWLRLIPYAGIQYSAVNHLVKAAVQISSALNEAMTSAEKILSPIQSEKQKTIRSVNPNQKKEILKNLYESYPTLHLSQSKIELAEIELKQIPKLGTIKQIKEAQNTVSKNLPQLKEYMNLTVTISKLLPALAGYPEEQTYLFLLENNSELRPGGGFIGTYGIIKVKDGDLTKLKTDNIYNLDHESKIHIDSPWQFKKYVDPELESWYLRDSNWSPDFPTDAKQAIWFYNEEGGEEQKLDGTIAITPTFIEYLLEVTGPIKARDEKFTAENITEKIQYFTTALYEGKVVILEQKTRKGIIGDLAKSLLGEIFLLKQQKWPKLLDAIKKGLDSKQALIYFKNKDAENFLAKYNWAGEIFQQTNHNDYLLVVDSSMASLKTDPYIERKILYEVSPEGKAKVSITYINNAVPTLLTTRYRSWTRIYVPLNSQLIKIEGNEGSPDLYPENFTHAHEVSQDLNKTVFGTFLNVETQETKTLSFEYTLPRDIINQIQKGNYNLIVQKQPGVIDQSLNINITAPRNIKEYSPFDLDTIENNNIQFKTKLNSDKGFSINY